MPNMILKSGQLAQLLLCFAVISTISAYILNRTDPPTEPGYPVILIPGDGGSQLEANLTGKPEVIHYVCSKLTPTWFDLWLNLQLFAPVVIDCWVDNMKLVYNSSTGLSRNMPGVDIRVPGFAATESIEWLDKSKASTGLYFFTMVDSMVSWGYKRGENVLGAPYDWRKSPVENHEYFITLKTLIEVTYRSNGNKKVVIVAHSMGNPTMLYFYKHYVDQAWKDKFIKSHVGLAGAWGGSMQIIRLMAAGYNMNYYRVVLSPYKLREMQRSFTSSAFLFPSTAVWNDTEIMATTDAKNYTLSDIKEFFYDINYPIGWLQYKEHAQLLGNLDAPGVQVHCIYGTGVETPENFIWGKGYFPDYQPTTIMGDGDGTVNTRSGAICSKWNKDNNQGKKVTVHPLPKAEHMAILQHPTALELVRKAIYDQL